MNKKFVLITSLLLAATIATTWLTVDMVKSTSTIHPVKDNNPDAFMTKVTYTKMTKTGIVSNKMQTPYVQHYPYQNSSNFNQPIITIFRDNQQPWLITANHGNSQFGNKVIKLLQNVKLQQSKGLHNQPFTITSDSATIYLPKKIAETHSPITLQQPGIVVKAVGAKANLNTKTVKLLSKVRQTQTDKSEIAHLQSKQASYYDKIATTIYEGNVKYRKETTNLNCQKLVVHSNQKTRKITKIVAYGQQAQYSTLPKGKKHKVHANANKIEYYPLQGIARLLGNAKVTQHNDQFSGDLITYNEKTQTVAVQPTSRNKIHITFQP